MTNDAIAITTIEHEPRRSRIFCLVIEINFVAELTTVIPASIFLFAIRGSKRLNSRDLVGAKT